MGFVSKLIHKKLESRAKNPIDSILEIWAGSGQHFEFVTQKFRTYFETDIRISNIPNRPKQPGREIQVLGLDAANLQAIDDSSLDRLVASCLLIHLDRPEEALREWRRVAKNGGDISFYIPCEPGLFLRFLRILTTARKAKKEGVDHYSFHYREHLGYFVRLNHIAKEVFEYDSLERIYWPFPFLSWNLNLGAFYFVRVKKGN